MVELKENIVQIAEKTASEFGLFLIEVNLRGNERNRIIEIYIDGEKVVSAENLAEVSRAMNDIVETSNLIKGSYRLDVSTPGVERPLKFLKQFSKHVNRKFEVSYNSDEGEENIKGTLKSINEDVLEFESGKSTHYIKFSKIINAKVIISFS